MRKSFYGMLLCALSVAACSTPVPLQDRLLEHDAEINEVIARMTLEEKVEMLHSKTNMSSGHPGHQVHRRSLRHTRGGRPHRLPVRRLAA